MYHYKTYLFSLLHVATVNAAILPPPWADSSLNPCASQPGGWLFLFWPPDGKCYRIFQRGHPCPDTMELGPVHDAKTKRMVAECRCPPGTAQSARDAKCHQLFTKGPCHRGQYFSPVPDNNRKRWGKCMDVETCGGQNELYWPQTGQCFTKYTRGPCQHGQLLTYNKENGLTECKCDSSVTMSKFYWPATKSCYEWYTKGPCLEKGSLYLPGPKCDCRNNLPNYHNETGMCYELGGIGPCKPGHRFIMDESTRRGKCVCKPDHVTWSEDGHCYRVYTRGPCGHGQIIFNSTSCVDIPCRKGRLYFPGDDSCYRIGVRGPCPHGQLVLFEKSVRPSVEGISYKGVCGCPGTDSDRSECENTASQQQESTTITMTTAGAITTAANNSNSTRVQEDGETVAESRTTATTAANNSNSTRVQEEGETVAESRTTATTAAGKTMCDRKKENCQRLYTRAGCDEGEWLVPLRQARSRRNTHIPWSINIYLGGANSHRFKTKLDQEQVPRLYQESEERRRRKKVQCECRPGYTRRHGKCQLPFIQLASFLNGQDYFAS